MSATVEAEKKLAAEAAAELVADGMRVGLGTGSTVAHLLPALAARRLEIRCVATSPRTERAARELGLSVEPFADLDRLEIAIDGADQVAPTAGWSRAAAALTPARRSWPRPPSASSSSATRPSPSSGSSPVPLELHRFGLRATLRELGSAELREGAEPTPDDGVLADYREVNEPGRLAVWLGAVPGVVEHGLFSPALVSEVLIGRDGEVERLAP